MSACVAEKSAYICQWKKHAHVGMSMERACTYTLVCIHEVKSVYACQGKECVCASRERACMCVQVKSVHVCPWKECVCVSRERVCMCVQ